MIRLEKFSSSIKRVVGIEELTALELNGAKYKVGVNSQHSQNIVSVDELIKFYPLFVKEAGNRGFDIKNIVLSLPLNHYLEARILQANEKPNKIEQLVENITNEVGDKVENIAVYPQAMSSLYYIKKEFDEDLTNKRILFIDGGFNSLIIGLTSFGENNELETPIFHETILNQHGVRDLLEQYFAPLLKSKFTDLSSNLHVLNRIFQEEEIYNGITKVSVKEEKTLAINIYANDIFNKIINKIDSKSLSYDAIAIIGGLNYLIGELNLEGIPVFHTKKNAEYLTTLGMLEKNPDFTIIDGGFGDVKIGANVEKINKTTKTKLFN